jgi:hypothetical protein
MEGREKPHADKYKAITNDWNYNASCTLTLLLTWDLENFKSLVFVVQIVHAHFLVFDKCSIWSVVDIFTGIHTDYS